MTPSQIEDAIRGAAALTAALATRNRGADPARWAAVVIADSVAFEAGQDPP